MQRQQYQVEKSYIDNLKKNTVIVINIIYFISILFSNNKFN